MNVPHPIPYQGSKRRLAPAILAFFPEAVGLLVEPFAGSAAVSIAALHSRRVKSVHINDLNQALMRLWRAIVYHPETIAAQYRRLWREQIDTERQFYDSVRDRFNQTGEPGDFLYLLARCVKASIRYNAYGQFNQSPDNRRRGMNPDTMEWHIYRASRLLKGRVRISAQDYGQVLDSVSPTDVVYMDPPYQGVCGNKDPRYLDGVAFDEFATALERLNDRGISYIVSYDGRTGTKTFGRKLPASLRLEHVEVSAGRSTQATLLGRDDITYESLYISPALAARLPLKSPAPVITGSQQLCLFERIA
jgi:DNA adenine methylase